MRTFDFDFLSNFQPIFGFVIQSVEKNHQIHVLFGDNVNSIIDDQFVIVEDALFRVTTRPPCSAYTVGHKL